VVFINVNFLGGKMKKNMLYIAMVSTLALSGCLSKSQNSEGTGATNTLSLSGIVADGYISGATVCIDINENNDCDGVEPTTTSRLDGTFTINGIIKGEEDHPFLAIIDTDAQDSDGRTFTSKLFFSTPRYEKFVVSPFSTMIHHKLRNDSALTIVTAKEELVSQLGLTIDPSDITLDFIKKEVDEAQNQIGGATKYRDTHRAAQLLTTVFGEEFEKAKSAVPNSTNEGAIFDLMMEKLISYRDPASHKTFIREISEKIALEIGNNEADFMSVTLDDIGHDSADDRYADLEAELDYYETNGVILVDGSDGGSGATSLVEN